MSKFKKGDLVKIEAGFYGIGIKTATIGIVIGYDDVVRARKAYYEVYLFRLNESLLFVPDELRKLSK